MYVFQPLCQTWKLEQIIETREKQSNHSDPNMSTTKETEGRNEEGTKEVKVNTVDYRSLAGQEAQGAKKENVEVIHRIDEPKDETPGVIAQAAAKVAEKIQPAKEAISGSRDQKSK